MNENPLILADAVTFLNTHSTAILIATIVLVGIIAVVSLCIRYLVREAEKARHMKQYKEWRRRLKSNGSLPEFDAPIALRRDEVCYYSVQGARLCEPRAVRSGQYGGVSTRALAGVSIHSGGFRSESHDEWRCQDVGSLCVTSRRIVFAGGMQTRVIDLADIIASQASVSHFQLSSSQRQKAIMFDNVNGQIIRDVLTAILS